MKPYYEHAGSCECGCGGVIARGKRFVSGHNRRGATTSDSHKEAISKSQAKAWQTKRERMPVGATWIDAAGYVRVKVEVGSGRWKLQHVLVVEERIGRKLNAGEIVHHIDGDRKNNASDNLYLCRNHAHHMAIERQIKELFRAMLNGGTVVFSHETGAYSCR